MQRLSAALIALALCAPVFGACSSSNDRATPRTTAASPEPGQRTFEMGLSSLPSQLTDQSYRDAFALAGRAGDVILIQRAPPWEEMTSGKLSNETVRATERETQLARDNHLDIFVAIDPTEEVDGRSQIAGLPDRLRGAGFDNEDVQKAFIAYAQYVARNYKPKYLALGVEINSYQQQHRDDFDNFVALYQQAYQAVKALSPDTLVFPTFQYEELQGLLPAGNPLPPQWNLIGRFEPNLDLLAISSYPSLVYAAPQVIPASYFAQLPSHSNRPIVISGLGYASEPGSDGSVIGASEAGQAQFLQRALDNAQQLGFRLVIWFVGQDPVFTATSGFDAFRQTGLVHENGSPKPAWLIWQATARRPLAAR